MKGLIPSCLVIYRGPTGHEWLTVSDCDGNEILFAFSSLATGEKFCSAIAIQGNPGFVPYCMTDTVRELEPWCISSRAFLVALDAAGIADRSYNVVKLADLIKAAKEGMTEIEYSVYQPRRQVERREIKR